MAIGNAVPLDNVLTATLVKPTLANEHKAVVTAGTRKVDKHRRMQAYRPIFCFAA